MTFDQSQIIEKINSVEYWYHQIEIRPGIVTPGITDSQECLKFLKIPTDCSGLRVLDLGTRDGFFAFEFEKRGAEVVAIDYFPSEKSGFKVASELLNSKVTFFQDNIYNVSVEKYGTFDIVLFLGLLYHLRDPLRALEIIREVCKDELYIETQIIDNAFLMPNGQFVALNSLSSELEQAPIMQFYPGNSLNNDFTNYWAPNLKCLELMLIESNFSVVEEKLYGHRGLVKCKIASDPGINYHLKIANGVINLK